MKKQTPEKWLEARNKAAIASVPEQDAATKELEAGIEAHRAAIARQAVEKSTARRSKRSHLIV